MARTPVVMPKMSMTMTEGEVVELLISVGQKVSQGDVIAVVGTDKTNMEVESDFDGTVLEITSKPGDVIDVGAPMFILETEGEDLLADLFSPTAAVETPAVQQEVAAVVTPIATAAATAIPLAMPGARQMAQQLGIDLVSVTPASSTGVIKQTDLTNAPRLQKAQLAVAKAVTTALGVPQFSISKTLFLKNLLPAEASERLALVTSAWLKTLDAHSKLNSQFSGDQILPVSQVRIAYLTKTVLGFVSPVVAGDQATASGIEEVLARAKNNQIALDNLTGATTSITDLLGYGLDSANLLLLPPQSTALTLAALSKDGERVALTVSLSVDHRVADPGDAAEALSSFERFLENG